MCEYSDEEDEENPLSGFWLEGDSLAPPCQAELDVVQEILTLALGHSEEKEEDECVSEAVVFDLGCGDGRICLEAARRFGCRAVGVEIEERLVEKARRLVANMELSERVEVRHEDLLETDLSTATVIVCYLLPEAIELIKPKLEEALRRGVRLVCNTWGPKGFKSVKTVQCGLLNASVTLLMFDHTSIEEASGSGSGSVSNSDSNDRHIDSDTIKYDTIYITYCSKGKRDDAGNLPAIDRYTSDRITRVSELASQASSNFMILSGSFGLLERQDKIPYYDHLLISEEVADMVNTVSQQLVDYAKSRGTQPTCIKYFEVQEDPFVGPYKQVIQLVCQQHSIDLDIITTSE